MLIKETSKITNLTKKAIEYYIGEGLINPIILDNGYRDFSEDNVESLKKISVLRKLGLSIREIQSVLNDETKNVLQKLCVEKELSAKRECMKKTLLENLSCGKSYDEIKSSLKGIENSETITEKLLDSFPGYYGRFICLHFAQFLNEPIKTSIQQSAYEEMISFLDNVQEVSFPKDVQEFLEEHTNHIDSKTILKMIQNTKQSIENPEDFLSENKKMIEEYLLYKQSEEYKNSPANKIQAILQEFNSTSGYYDVFIPAMKRLSSSYENYYKQMEVANEKFISKYPEVNNLK